MVEQLCSSFDDKETEPETIGAAVVATFEGLENPRQALGANADTIVTQLRTTAAELHAPTAGCVIDRVAHQVAEHAAE